VSGPEAIGRAGSPRSTPRAAAGAAPWGCVGRRGQNACHPEA
jgi:hypothetical protein